MEVETITEQLVPETLVAPLANLPSGNLPAVRGRPWVKGQSGNPAGRPRRFDRAAAKVAEQARMAAIVADNLITGQTVPLAKKLVARALAGDNAALRFCLEHIVPKNRGPRVPPPPVADDGNTARLAIAVITDAAAAGIITGAQAAILARMLMIACCES